MIDRSPIATLVRLNVAISRDDHVDPKERELRLKFAGELELAIRAQCQVWESDLMLYSRTDERALVEKVKCSCDLNGGGL